MITANFTLLADVDLGQSVVGGTPGGAPAESGANNVSGDNYQPSVAVPGAPPPTAPPETGGLGGMMPMLLIWGGVIIVMYLLMFRPQRKREKERKEMQSNITTGDNVVTNAGLFGRIADVGEDCFIIEFGTNRGIRIPILKSEVAGIRNPKMTPEHKND